MNNGPKSYTWTLVFLVHLNCRLKHVEHDYVEGYIAFTVLFFLFYYVYMHGGSFTDVKAEDIH